MKIVTIIGARPQFIKAAVVSKEIGKNKHADEIIIHTGQHFDANMSRIFFDQMQIPKPDYNLNIHSLSHGKMTASMLTEIEKKLEFIKPDWVLIYGDTNSTLAGALAAVKMQIPIAHVEAGLRSFNNQMPEEINRILADKCSDLLFCPTDKAVENLTQEGIGLEHGKIVKTGDVMLDAALHFRQFAVEPDFIIPDNFILATLHRAENTDDPDKLDKIISALNLLNQKIPLILPLHPRTKQILASSKRKIEFEPVEPVGYLEMLYLIDKCRLVITDSGGLQKEAFFFHKPCLTLREETEWTELVDCGCNILCGSEIEKILQGFEESLTRIRNYNFDFYGRGDAAVKIVEELG